MGLSLSTLVANANPKAPPKVVLVPPMFERDIKDRDRFAYSSYDYLFAKRQLHFLFNDYVLQPGPQRIVPVRGLIRFSPPADPKISVEADVGTQPSMSLRYQPLGAAQTSTFIDVRANPLVPGDVTLRASWLDPSTGVGLFATAPLAKKISGTFAQLGARYSSPNFTAGAITTPRTGALSNVWAAGRYGALMLGASLRLDGATPGADKGSVGSEDVLGWVRGRTRCAIAYEPTFTNETGRGSFSAVVELIENRSLVVSFFQHMALSRRVLNPMESSNVVGITNYVDLGMQITVPTSLGDEEAAATKPGSAAATKSPSAADADAGQGSVNVAAAWQVNKNILVKCVVGSDAVSLSVGAKTWGRLGVVGAASVAYRYGDSRGLRYGGWLQLENFGAARYERGLAAASGRGVLQRHEASAQDVENAEGTRRVVAEGAEPDTYNVPPTDATRNFM
eukprot:CAMPEP_0202868642 /NCGR_PEP_ID=MMETSP1391-20130828/10986_1 /ASSEMBLY_ACC=CAM_ASM_000867 /TAXON_ID=1034604 /ORGANISM="Chlamydomonas leiostraca, Strain SAG 11-49" /LENGTH=450 /DNA_ID=CAMNT_0049548829 /DNA_START=23 /DNA_END=1375 /DNA_ORIENTATION=+